MPCPIGRRTTQYDDPTCITTKENGMTDEVSPRVLKLAHRAEHLKEGESISIDELNQAFIESGMEPMPTDKRGAMAELEKLTGLSRKEINEFLVTHGRQAYEPTTVYRLFDEDLRLLYVGVAGNPGRRFEQHSIEKPWWGDVAHVRLRHFDTREAALDAELEAIRKENPLHNKAGR